MTLRRLALWTALGAAAAFTFGCSRQPATTPAAKSTAPAGEFSKFVDDYFSSYFRANPTAGTYAGLHEYDSKLEDLSAQAVRNRIAEVRRLGARLTELRKSGLSDPDAVDATILDNQIKAELLEYEVIRSWRKNPMMYAGTPGASVDLLMKRAFAPPPERLRSVIARLQGVPALLQAMRTNVSEPPREFTDLALRMLKGSSGFFRGSVAAWAKEAAGTDAALLSEFESHNAKAIAEIDSAAQYLEKELLPVSSGKYAIGADTFARKLQFEEMVDVPLDKLLAIGETTLDRDSKAFVETARKIGKGSPAEVIKNIGNDHPTEDKLISFASATAENIRTFVIDKKIIAIPSEVRPTIAPTPPYARTGGFASMDTPGPFETKAREAFYYITPVEPDWSRGHKEEHLRLFNRPVMDIITVHEAYPGHYVQFLYAPQFPTKTRKLTFAASNAEGWAHYAEQMMVEQGFGGGDPKIKLAQLSEALVRDARYVAGIKLHTAGMTVEQAARLFVEKAFMEPANALEEARRGTYNPTYLYYTLGKLQIYKLREDYRRAKGSAYTLGQFHADFVKQGALPLKLMRQVLLPGDTGSTL